MKCPNCGGKGKYKNGFGKIDVCYYCLGTGEVNDKGERVKTEQEYIQSCNHKELTEILFRMIVHGSVIRPDRQYISEWLKQPHHEKE